MGTAWRGTRPGGRGRARPSLEHLEQRVTPAGDLRIELLAAPNFIVDSNLKAGPTAAYLEARFTNTGTETLTNVFAHVGNYVSGGTSTPGIYPVVNLPGAADPAALTGTFSLTHQGGSADATRPLGTLAPGQSAVQYWLVTYPWTDADGTPAFRAQANNADDLVLSYDVWVNATAAVSGALTRDVTSTATLRSEISAMANKIWPNTTSKVPNEYLDAFQKQLGWRPDQIAPGVARTEGVWYDFGRVNQGFDADANLVPDYDVWSQPVGDATAFDARAWRLVHTYGVLIVKLNDGTEQVIAFEDRLYHKDLPANNTGVVGLVFYEFAPIGVGPGQLSPYQEAASGSNNEKFNGDYGTFVGGPTGTPPTATFDKSGPASVAPNTTVTYDLTVTNTGSVPFGLNQFGAPTVLSDTIPTGTQYVAGSADDNLALPSGVTVQIYYSGDNGVTWTATDLGVATTNLQWWLSAPLAPGQSATVHFQTLVPSGYAQSQVYNLGGVGLGNTAPLYTDAVNSLVTGTLTISGLVYRDDGSGGGTTGDGVRQAGETTLLGNITVTLYPDTDGDGVLDAAEAATPRATTSSAAGTGVWSFTNLPSGKFIVEVKRDDTDRPTGFVLSTSEVYAVTLSGASQSGFEFGFAPTLDVAKTLLSPTPVLEGTQITYNLDVTNLLKPDGFVASAPTVSNLWLESTTGSSFTSPGNATGAPDSAFATSATNNQTLVGNYVSPHPAAPAGSIAKVEAVIQLKLSGTLSSDTLSVNVRRNNSSLTTLTLNTDTLHAFLDPGTGLVAVDVTGLAAWAWADFQRTDTGLTLTVNGSGGAVPTFSVDAFGYRVTTGSQPSPTGNVFWTDATTSVKVAPPSPTPATELDVYLQGLSATPTEIAFDEITGKMYLAFPSLSSGTIQVRNLDGTGTATNLLTGVGADISGLAVDGVHGYLYWTRAGSTDTINRRNLDGSGTTLTLTGLANPEGVAIDPVGAQVYWLETQGNSLRIRRSDLDFSTASTIDLFTPTVLGSGNHNPFDLEIDTIRRKLYWVDNKSGTNDDFIGVVNLDGTGLRQFITQSDAAFGDNPVGLGIDVQGGFIYWSDTTGIKKSAVTGGPTTLVSGLASLGDVEVPGWLTFTGTFDPDKTLSLVPLTDDYDPAELRFVSASLAPTSVNTTTGLISWANVGPIHPNATRTIQVTFEVLEPPGNATSTAVDNTAAVTGARVANGLPANDDTSTVVLTVEPTATLGDLVWSNRVTANGTQDAGEPGIPGVRVDLYDSTGAVRLQTTTTDANGNYLFKGVTGTAGGTTYIVRIDRSTLPGGLSATNNFDPDGGTAHESNVTVTDPTGTTGPGDNLTRDFGYAIPNVFFGVLYQDFDGDGTHDASDAALAGVTVRLLDNGGGTIATTTTAVDGAYYLTAANAGSYRVVVDRTAIPTSAWTQTGDPDATLDDRNTALVTVASGEVKGSYDFGYRRIGTSALGNDVFLDLDGDNVKDLGEDGIPNITVLLYEDVNANGVLEAGIDALVATTATNANGVYNFTNLAAGRYLVVVDEQDVQFPANVIASTGNPAVVTLPAATTLTNVDFGYRPGTGYLEPGTIGDFVYYDANRNGEQDYNETGIGGVVLRLYADQNNNQVYDAGTDLDYGTVTTSSGGAGNPPAGFYLFTGLAPDSSPGLPGNNPYTIQVLSIPTGAGTTLANQTADPNRDGVPVGDNSFPGLPAADNQDTGVWRDLNTNNVRDAGEVGIFINYGTAYSGGDFGYQPTGVVGDYVFLDLNNNGIQDLTELGLANVAVAISNTAFGGGTTLNTTTDVNGLYFFQGLTAGTWRITVTPPSGLVPSTRVDANLLAGTGSVGANTADLTVDAAGNVTRIVIGASTLNFAAPHEDDGAKIDFGYRLNGPNTLSGKVVLEQMGATDGNSGEATDIAVAGATVFLYDGSNNPLGAAVTDATGAYSFSGLPSGTYKLSMAANRPILANTTLTTDNFAPGSVPAGATVADSGTAAILTVPVSGNVANADFAWISTVNYDFGDLPDSYGTTLAADGARHIITGTPTLYLGSVAPDTEPNGAPSPLATGDDAGTADEGGVTVLNAAGWTEGAGSGANDKLRVVVNGSGWLVGWIDFDGDGTFLDSSELVANQAVTTGTTDLAVTVPAGTFVSGGAFLKARFRLFAAQPLIPQLAFTGSTTGGEVEDYLFTVGNPPLQADLQITKTDGSTTYTPGAAVTYTIVVTNAGPNAVTNATVTDTLPATITGATWTAAYTGTGSSGPVSGSGNISAGVNLGVGGSATFTLTGTVASTATGNLVNTASVTAPQGTTDPTPGNNSATDTDTPAPRADLAITKTDGSTTYTAGGAITYTIVVTNNGPSFVTGATVADSLPAAIAGATWTATYAGTGSSGPANGSGNINATVNLAVGGTATFTLTGAVIEGTTGNLVNTATVTAPAGTTDPTPGNNSATDTDNDPASPTADLAITKTDGSASYTPGAAITYTLVVTNNGPTAVTGATVTDTLPAAIAGATWTAVFTGSGSSGTTSGSGNINETINLAVGGTATYTLSGTVNSTFTSSLVNTATVTAPSGINDLTPGNNSATDTDTAAPRADLAITKTDGSATYTAGTSVTYIIVVTNNGPSFVTTATVADTLPASITGATWTAVFTGTGSTGTASGSGNINQSINLASGGTATYTVTGTVASTATGNLVNTATVSVPEGTTDPTPGNNSATDTDAPAPRADLQVTKTDGSATYTAGASITYTVVVTNAGPSFVTGATVTDTLPASLTGATWTAVFTGAGSTGTASGSGNISQTINLASGGTATYTLTGTVQSGTTGNLVNTATVAAPSGTTDPTPGNNSATDTDAPASTADLAITKTDGSSTYTPGTAITYTLVVTNNGPNAVTGATVTDTLPVAIAGVTWTAVFTGAGSNGTANGSGNINQTINLASGGTATYTVTGTVSSTATDNLVNTATVAAPSGTTDPTPGNNSATDTDTPAPRADLHITKTDGSSTYTPGTAITYTVVVTNAGPSFVTGATVTDTLPAAITGVTWTAVFTGTGSTGTASGSGNISQTINLAAGGTATYTVTGTVASTATGNLVNTATVSAPEGTTDPTPGNNSATDTDTPAPRADLQVTKTDGSSTYTPGATITYTVVVTNAGPSFVMGATVTDTLPAAITGATWTATFTGTGSTGTASGSGNISQTINLASGGTATYTVTGTVASTATGNLINTATVAVPSGTTDPNPGNNSATDTDTPDPRADLMITKTDGSTTYTAGSAVTYTLVVTNVGPSFVTGATVTDTLPAVITGVTWTATFTGTGSTGTAGGSGNISQTINLAAGGTATYTVTGTVASTATGDLVNTATVAAPTGTTDPVPGNNSATDTDTAAPRADLAVTKTDGSATFAAGSGVTYTVVVTNNGPSFVTGATVTDLLPAALTNATWSAAYAGVGSSGPGNGTGDINATVNLAPGGTATFTVTGTVSSTATGNLVNTATVAAPSGTTDPTPGNNSATDTDTPTPGTLGDLVWDDRNGNGLLDAGEPGVAGVAVELYDGAGTNRLAATTTGVGGAYQFTGLMPGSYQIRFVPPTGRALTAANRGGDEARDSDADPATGFTGVLTLFAGNVNNAVDAGLYTPVTAGDLVWYDVDGDGVLDAGEPGIPGVTVTATWFGPDGLAGGGDDRTFSAATAADGSYQIANLPPGNYGITTSAPPNGLTVPTAGVSGFTLTSGVNRSDLDFGFTGQRSFGDRVWLDFDGDGAQDADEPGLTGVAVTAVWAGPDGDLGTTGDNAALATATGPNGMYTFTGLPTGLYRVSVAGGLPPGVANTGDPDGVFDGSTAVTLGLGAAPTDIDFGYQGNGALTGFAYGDRNADGTRQAAEPGVGGVTVTLTGTDVRGNTIQRVTTTAADGSYRFGGLLSGTYTLTETQPAAYSDGLDAVGSAGGTAGNDVLSAIALGTGVTGSGYNFGERGATISGKVFIDGNGSGAVDAGEAPLGGVAVTLLDAGGAVVAATTSTGDGTYAFPEVPAGAYRVVQTQPPGYATSTPNTLPVVVPLSGLGNVNFGELLGGIAGVVYLDANGNGTRDAGEPGLPGVAVALTGTDVNGNPVRRDATTVADGAYAFNDLVGGSYAVTETQPAGFADGLDAAGSAGGVVGNDAVAAIPLGAGVGATGYAFGEQARTGAVVSGLVFHDVNRDGTPQGGEAGLAGVVVELRDANGFLVATTATAADGSYLFGNVQPGDYQLREIQPTGYGSSTPNARPVTVPATGLFGQHFGDTTGSLGGAVFLDANGNGARDAGEPGLGGAAVTLTGLDDGGARVNQTLLTGPDGVFTFANLLSGTYTLAEAQPPGFLDGADRVGPLGGTLGNDVVRDIALGAGLDGTEYTFGELVSPGLALLSGSVFVDGDADGVRDGGERGLTGVTLTLRDGSGSVVATATTGADGLFAFPGVAPGAYTLSEAQPAGYGDSTPNVRSVTVPEAGLTGQDFGDTTGALAGSVYLDANGNGRRDSGESGVPGAAVMLTGTDVGGNPVLVRTTTGADGAYLFAGLLAGNYALTEVQPNGLQDGPETAGTLGGDTSVNDRIFALGLAPGQRGDGYLFAERNVPLGSLRGAVYVDQNNDGVRQSAEPGLAGVLLTLTDSGGAVAGVTATGADGSYRFEDLVPGLYNLAEAQPAGYDDGLDALGNAGGVLGNDAVDAVMVLSGGNATGYTFGERLRAGTGSLTGVVFLDADRDGLPAGGESGQGGALVEVRDALGNLVASSRTGADGSYRFDNLPPGAYQVSTTLPTGYGNSTPLARAVAVAAGAAARADFGLTLGTLAGFVYLDAGAVPEHVNDGVRQVDEGESGYGGVLVTLTGVDVNGASVRRSLLTAADGSYRFDDLVAGTYTLTEARVAGLFDGKDSAGSLGGTAGNDRVTDIRLPAGVAGVEYNFGELPPADPNGYVFIDADNDGVRDPGERGIPGVPVRVTGFALDPADAGNVLFVDETMLTDANGFYAFTTLPPSAAGRADPASGRDGYTLRAGQPAGFLDGREQNGTPPAGLVLNDLFGNIFLAPLGFGADYNFGELVPASLAGFAYDDANNNGVRDADETGIANVRVTLSGTDDLGNAVGATTFTGASGAYRFDGLRPGAYRLAEAQPAGFLDGKDAVGSQGGVADNDAFTVAVTSGLAGTDNNFGEVAVGPVTGIGPALSTPAPGPFPLVPAAVVSKLGLLASSTNAAAEVRFLNRLYNDVLNRAPDQAGIDFWLTRLLQGRSRAEVAAAFVQCPEHRALQVRRLYQNFLRRTPVAVEVTGWVNAFMAGASEVDVARAFLTSAEYQARHLSDAAFVTGLYADVLGRVPDDAGQAFWVTALQNGVSRSAVAHMVLTSAEAHAGVVRAFYTHFLGRDADAPALQFLVGHLGAGRLTPSTLAVFLLASEEYARRGQ